MAITLSNSGKIHALKQKNKLENGMNYEGIRRMLALVPCWRLRNCDQGEQDRCAAFHNSSRPCWATEEKCANPLPSCRDCAVYRKTIDCDDVKKLIYG